jgi:DNA-binding response OmpR family regulator/predicted RNA-binding Zn-ribbon protein involved in translation (DUF1610 family)
MNSTLTYTARILVVDDDPGILEFLKTLLTRRGFEVILANSGKEALQKMDMKPDLVLLDIMMPGMDGYEVCKRIRQDSQVPIVFLSAKSREEDIIKGLEFKADDYIPKPFPSKLLVAKISAILETTKRYKNLEAEYRELKQRLADSGDETKPPKFYSQQERNILAHLLKNSALEIKMDLKPTLEPPTGIPVDELWSVLDLIEADGFALKKEVDNHLLCPKCGGFNTKPSFSCPTCRVKSLEKVDVIEHLSCGNLDRASTYERDKKLVCPKCGKELRTLGVDYRKIGNWFSCLKGHFFGHPWIVYRCNDCELDFPLEEGEYIKLCRYSVNPEKAAEAKKLSLDYDVLKNAVNSLGLNCEHLGKTRGRSGVELVFDFVASDKSTMTVIDFNTCYGELQEEKILQFIAKITELKPHMPIFVSLCKLMPSVRQMAENYGITVIEEDDFEKAVESITQCLRGG